MDILKIVLVSSICAVMCLILKQIRPEIVPFLQIASVILIFSFVYDGIHKLLSYVTDLLTLSEVVYEEYTYLLIRVLGITLITKTGTELCKDSGNAVIALIVEFAGKLMVLIVCFPLLKMIAELAVGMLN